MSYHAFCNSDLKLDNAGHEDLAAAEHGAGEGAVVGQGHRGYQEVTPGPRPLVPVPGVAGQPGVEPEAKSSPLPLNLASRGLIVQGTGQS